MPLPDRWLVLTVRAAAGDPLRDLIAEGLLALGGSSVLDEGDALTSFFDPPASPEHFLNEASRFLEDWIGGTPPDLDWRWRENEDWAKEWRRGLAPRKVSRRFVVKPTWTEWSAAPDEVIIEIDPQMAFGTGEHATTRGCLRLLDQSFLPGDRALDVGSGSGILSIAAALLGASEVVAVEFDPDANINARENLERNGVVEAVELREEMADTRLIRELGGFDMILANILSGVIRPLLPALSAALRPGGRLIVSGILQTESDAVGEAAEAAGLRVAMEDREGEWWSGLLTTAVDDDAPRPAS